MGVGISAFGGLAKGIAQGIQMATDMDEKERRLKLAEAANQREIERADREKTVFGFTVKDLERKENKAKDEDAALKELQSSFITDQPPAAPQAIANPNAAPSNEGYASDFTGLPTPGQAAPMGIATPAAAASAGAPAAAPATPTGNPFVTNLSGKELDAVYNRQAQALQKYFVARGEVDKAMQVPKMMQELRDFDWSNKVGAALAGMAGGAPGAREAFAKVYGVVNDGYDLDPRSGQYDPQKGFVGLVRINKETGERETFNLSPEQAMVIASKYKNPAEVIKFVVENQRSNREFGLKEREVGAREKSAQADVTRAGAAVEEAKSKGKYYDAYANALDRKNTGEANAAAQKAAVDSVKTMFPLAFREFKDEELLGKDRQSKLDNKSRQEMMANKTLDLAGLNPKVDVRTLAGIARSGVVDAQRDSDGRLFTMIGSTKIFLQ